MEGQPQNPENFLLTAFTAIQNDIFSFTKTIQKLFYTNGLITSGLIK